MEKIKNLLNPGKATDDEVMYGSGTAANPVHSGNTGILSGEGSHLSSATADTSGATTGTGPGPTTSSVGNTVNPGPAPTTAGPHTTDLANKADPRVDSDLDGSRTVGNTAGGVGATGAPETQPGLTTGSTNPYSAKELDPRLGAASQGTPTAYGSGNTGNTTGQSGLSSSTTAGSNDRHLGRDAAALGTAGAVGEGIHHHREDERQNVGTSGTGLGTGSSTDPAATGVGNTGSASSTGPHSSSLLNKLDPRVKSDNDTTTGTTGTTGSDHHYGRDAAAVGGAAAVGEGVHHHHEKERENIDTSGYTGTTPSGAGSSYYGGPAGTAVGGVSGPHTTTTANRLDPAINQSGAPIEDASVHHPVSGGGGTSADAAHGGSGQHHHHLGRDAAVGAGGVGLAEHEHHKHDKELTAEEREAKREHKHEAKEAKREHYEEKHHLGRDAAVGAGGVGLAEHEHHKHEREGGLRNTTGTYGDNSAATGTGTSGHHLGRDAALGAGGVGLAEHEHRKHEREGALGSTTGTTAATAGTGPAPNTAGPHSKDWMNKLDPRVNSDPNAVPTGSTGSHATTDTAGETTGMRNRAAYADPAARDTPGFVSSATHPGQATHGERDAIAGAGLTGAAGYEAEKHHAGQNQHGVSEGYDDKNLSKDHHYGRDAAAAGVVGGAAYEAEKHHKHDKDLTAEEKEEKRERKLEDKEAKREHHQEKKSHGLLSFLRTSTPVANMQNFTNRLVDRDKNKKYSKEEEDEFDRQEREHNSHKGRDAALGGAAVGGAAYEAEKHHGGHHTTTAEPDTMKPLPAAPGNHGIGTGEGTQNALLDRKRGEGYDTNTGSGHHLGRDTAAVGGAAALGEHEHRKHEHGVTDAAGTEGYPTAGTTLGDKLHGTERNRGVPGSTGYIDNNTGTGTAGTTGHHLGRDAVIGAGGVGLAAHEHRKHENEGTTATGTTGPHSSSLLNKLDPRVKSDNTTTADTTGQHHLGRDAAVGAGGVGLAEHEHRKHEREGGLGNTTGTYGDNTINTGTSTSGQHHIGRDAAIGAGGVGFAEHEHHKHDKDLTAEEREAKREQKHEAKEAKREHYEDKHHLGRDAAVGAGAAGVAEHEHRKHENEGTTATGTTGPHSSSLLNKLDPRVKSDDSTTTDTTGQHHLGRDVAVGAGGVGLAEHEHRKHEYEHGQTGVTGTEAYPPPGTTLGDKLHGVERNRGVPGPTGFVDDTSNTTGTTGTTGTTSHHHLGRDAAIGAGGVGLAEHEHHKHEHGAGDGNYTTTGSGAMGSSNTGSSDLGYGSRDPDTSTLGARTEADRSAGYVNPESGRHVLHKDPPADHPASKFNAQNY